MRIRIFYRVLSLVMVGHCFLSQGVFGARPEDLKRVQDTQRCPHGDLREVNLDDQDLKGVCLRGADLRGASLRNTVLGDADLYDTNLRGVVWTPESYQELMGADPYLGVTGRIRSLETKDGTLSLSDYREEDIALWALADQETPTATKKFIHAYLLETFGNEGEVQQARELYRVSGEMGLLEAYNNLGFMYERGMGGERNILKARGLYEKALAHPVAHMNMTRLLAMHLGTRDTALTLAKLYETDGKRQELEPDLLLSRHWYEKAASLGSLEALKKVMGFSDESKAQWTACLTQALMAPKKYELAQWYLHGHPEVGQYNLAEAIKLFREAALGGHAQAAFELSGYYGKGIKGPQALGKNPEEGLEFLRQAVSLGHVQATVNMAEHYQKGYARVDEKGEIEEMIAPDRNKALLLYTYAIETAPTLPEKERGTIYRQIGRTLGLAYEEGQGFDQNIPEAIRLYELASSHKSLTSTLSLVRILREQGDHKGSFEKLLLAKEIDTNGTDARIFYMLGQAHEKGWGVAKDLKQARQHYETAQTLGHPLAKIKLQLWDLHKDRKGGPPERGDDITQEISQLPLDIQNAFGASLERLNQEVAQDYKITTNIGTLLHSIKEDFESTQNVIKRIRGQEDKKNPHAEDKANISLRVNHEFIFADPHLVYYNRDIDQEISDEKVTMASLEGIAQEIRQAMEGHEAYALPLRMDYTFVLNAHIITPESLKQTRKRFVRLYQVLATTPPGTFGIMLAQNKGRCLDGVGEYFSELESQYIYLKENVPLGARVGRTLLNYKESFLKRYRNPLVGAHEEATEGQVLLKERMRLPLGLPGVFSNPLYPQVGQGDKPLYSPARVMTTFLRGGDITFQRRRSPQVVDTKTIYFAAYTPSQMIDVLRQEVTISKEDLKAQGKPERFLASIQLSDYIQKDAFLKERFETAFVEMEDNEYFRTTPEANAPNGADAGLLLYKKKFYEYLLLKTGYLLKTQGQG